LHDGQSRLREHVVDLSGGTTDLVLARMPDRDKALAEDQHAAGSEQPGEVAERALVRRIVDDVIQHVDRRDCIERGCR